MLHHLPEIHDRDVVAHMLHDAEVVADEQVGQTELFLQPAQQVQDLRLDRDVEGRDRLVADDQVRLGRQRPRHADALALAAGELVREQGLLFRAQADQAEQFGDPVVAAFPVADIELIERRADNLAGAAADLGLGRSQPAERERRGHGAGGAADHRTGDARDHRDAAYILGMEHEIGSIRAGKKADFPVLEADPFETPPGDLKDIPVWGTVFEGQPAPLG